MLFKNLYTIADVDDEDVDVCSLDIVIGPCEAYMPSWGFDTEIGECVFFDYGGCEGNGNRFATEDACKAKCHKSGIKLICCFLSFFLSSSSFIWLIFWRCILDGCLE